MDAVNRTAQSFAASQDFSVSALGTRASYLLAASLANAQQWPWYYYLLGALLSAVAYDQIAYQIRKGGLAGPLFKTPFIGPFLESVNPKFEEYHAKWMSGDLSCVSVFHKFVVIASTCEMSRKVLNSPSFVKPCVVDIAHKLLRPQNWVFLDGKAHVDYRKGLNGLFTRQALEIYLPQQEKVYDEYFTKFLEVTKSHNGEHFPFMPDFRELMCAVSLRTFTGEYLPDSSIKRIADEYYKITAALELVNFPIILPFTKPWYGKQAADYVLEEFCKASAKAKVRIAAGGKVECILDAWVKQQQDSEAYRQKIAAGKEVPESEKPPQVLRQFTDLEISMTLFTFLFASQDATSSACTWLFQRMADMPEILDKVRAENLALRNGDRDVRLSIGMLEKMTYTRAVVKEVLRQRPPVLMVPYEVKKNFPITENYTIPKGSMVVPATYPALHDPAVYPEPETFNPDRWISGTAEQQNKNWLVFGTGPHYCLGQVYATHNLMALVGKASMHLDWSHKITPDSEKIKVFATIFPQDDCLLTFNQRPDKANKIQA